MKEPLFPRHTATLLQYIGIGLISGAISHGFFSGFRSLVTALIGIVVFVIGLMYEGKLSGSKVDMGKVLLIGVVFSISTAMVAGGFQHFLDSPWRSVWIIPVGYFISLLAYRIKENIKTSFFDVGGKGLLVSVIVAVLFYPLAQMTPAYVSVNDHHGENTGHEIMKQKHGKASAMNGMDHSMMDHGAMVTSEASFVVNMIPHHQEAVDTARLILAKGESAELKKLAQAIITAQEKEIAMMQKWSKDWNYSAVTPSYENMMGDGTKLSGKDLDTWFLQGMIMHHEGAVQMAESLLKLNARKEVSDFAREVIRVQSSEIEQMRNMLGKPVMNKDHH
jgi:uncharacterized protein (DUF305 family)